MIIIEDNSVLNNIIIEEKNDIVIEKENDSTKIVLEQTGERGPQGPPGINGVDGREVEFQTTATHIQWRYVGDSTWNDLIALLDLEGPQGPQGPAGTDGREIELQTSATHIQWRYVGNATWNDLIPLSDLEGPQGLQGIQGPQGPAGDDGREIELQTNSTHIQWRYVGDATWNNLVLLSDLEGPQGLQGVQGPQGPAGDDGREIELQTSSTHIQWRYVGDATWNDLVLLSNLQGPQGPQGLQGPQGPQGPQGIQGEPGQDGVGVPPGGNTGQILAKASTADYDTEWVDDAGFDPSSDQNITGNWSFTKPLTVGTLTDTADQFVVNGKTVLTRGGATNKHVVQIMTGPGASGIILNNAQYGYARFETSTGPQINFNITNWGGVGLAALGKLGLQSNAAMFRYKGDANAWNGAGSLMGLTVNTSFPTKPALEVRADADNGPVLSSLNNDGSIFCNGVIMDSTNKQWNITINDNGSLVATGPLGEQVPQVQNFINIVNITNNTTIDNNTTTMPSLYVVDSSSAVIVTLSDAPIGFQSLVLRKNSGTVTFAADSGFNLLSADSANAISKVYGLASIIKISATDWLIFGDIE